VAVVGKILFGKVGLAVEQTVLVEIVVVEN